MGRSALSPDDKRILDQLERLDRRRIVESKSGTYPDALNKRLVGYVDGISFFVVNGEFVRKRLDVEFTMNCNWRSDMFVHEKEAWIDDRLSPFDGLATMKHELFEWQLMRGGAEATAAHDEAAKLETEFRKKFRR